MGKSHVEMGTRWLGELGYNVKKDKYQNSFVQSLLAPIEDKRIIFVDAKAGTGKTTISSLCGAYWIDYTQELDKILYLRNALSIRDQGFLPGELSEKEYVYFAPIIDALDEIKPGTFDVWSYSDNQKNAKVEAKTTTYLRGVNFKNSFVIIDEAQNLNLSELRTTLTRIHDTCKVVVVGCTGQNDDTKNLIKGKTPFEWYIKHFKTKPYAITHELVTNYRGDLSNHSDDIMDTINSE